MKKTTVHPRVCGEQRILYQTFVFIIGSSPRVWGTESGTPVFRPAHRFIPACVGNSIGPQFSGLGFAVHPRVCGEQKAESDPSAAKAGSSPRVWGTEGKKRMKAARERFIPACVGNSHRQRLTRRRMAVHPRVCGEQDLAFTDAPAQSGSSPRVWGTDAPCRGVVVSYRFIPACVGNRFTIQSIESSYTVHPRVCGEQFEASGYPRS